MKIWLDDVRPAPLGWVACRWPEEVIALLKKHGDQVEEVSLDHDLGDDNHGTGYDVLLWIEAQVVWNGYKPPIIYIHSDNAAAVHRMRLAVESINRRRA